MKFLLKGDKMGWSSGSDLMRWIIEDLKTIVKDNKLRKKIYVCLINNFENEDWDTQDEVREIDESFDKALEELHPEWFNDNEEVESE